jgi:hypothetical protein
MNIHREDTAIVFIDPQNEVFGDKEGLGIKRDRSNI